MRIWVLMMIGLGLLVLVMALGIGGISGDPSSRIQSTKPVGTSTLSHGGSDPAHPDRPAFDGSPSSLGNP